MNAVEGERAKGELQKSNQPNRATHKFLKVILSIQEGKREQQWEGREHRRPLCGVTFVFFVARFLKWRRFMIPHSGSYFLFAASSEPSRCGPLLRPAPLRKREVTPTEDPSGQQVSPAALPLPRPPRFLGLFGVRAWLAPRCPCGPARAPLPAASVLSKKAALSS